MQDRILQRKCKESSGLVLMCLILRPLLLYVCTAMGIWDLLWVAFVFHLWSVGVDFASLIARGWECSFDFWWPRLRREERDLSCFAIVDSYATLFTLSYCSWFWGMQMVFKNLVCIRVRYSVTYLETWTYMQSTSYIMQWSGSSPPCKYMKG